MPGLFNRTIRGAAGSAISGTIGAVLLPTTAAAVGGVATVAAACALGGLILAIPLYSACDMYNQTIHETDNLFFVLGYTAVFVKFIETALQAIPLIGAAVLGISAAPVLHCFALGAIIQLTIQVLSQLPRALDMMLTRGDNLLNNIEVLVGPFS